MPINMAEAYLGAQRVKQNEFAMQRDRRQDDDEAAIRAAAQGAIDPATQQYDFNRHMQNLEQAGYGERAVVLRQQAAQRLEQTVKYLDRVIPYLNESNYPKAREGLKQIGIPDELLPAQYDPAWMTEKRRQLGIDLEQLEGFSTIRKTPAGGELVGQRNPATGSYENVRELDAPRPAGVARAGGGGGRPIPDIEKIRYLVSQGYSAEDAANLVYGNFGRPIDPGAEYGENIRPSLGSRSPAHREAGFDLAARATDEALRRSEEARIRPQAFKPDEAGTLPPAAAATLREGVRTRFANGQTWIMQGGRPVRVE